MKPGDMATFLYGRGVRFERVVSVNRFGLRTESGLSVRLGMVLAVNGEMFRSVKG